MQMRLTEPVLPDLDLVDTVSTGISHQWRHSNVFVGACRVV